MPGSRLQVTAHIYLLPYEPVSRYTRPHCEFCVDVPHSHLQRLAIFLGEVLLLSCTQVYIARLSSLALGPVLSPIRRACGAGVAQSRGAVAWRSGEPFLNGAFNTDLDAYYSLGT